MTIIQTEPVIWLLIILASIFCEAIFENFIYIWCAPSAAAALIADMSGSCLETQVQIFVLAALSLMLTFRLGTALRRRFVKMKKNKAPSAGIHLK